MPNRRPLLPKTKENSLICDNPVLIMMVAQLYCLAKKPMTKNDRTNCSQERIEAFDKFLISNERIVNIW